MNRRRYVAKRVYNSPEFQAFAKRFGLVIEGDGTKDISIHLPMNGFLSVTRHYNVISNDSLQLANEEPDDEN